jgi:Dolichyl-phosphate-mannose-protein mannosyltransferase
MKKLWSRRKTRLTEAVLVTLVIIAATAIRMHQLDAVPFWVDEAESSINAFTILQNGYPTDRYLGMPIYENTYIWAWPESREYAFRDISYSAKHFAIYHGWLPLYSIAASFAVAGIPADVVDGQNRTKHTELEQKERTRAGRLPAVLFGSLFLLVLFVGGKLVYGSDAGWAALLLGSVNPYHIDLSRQARYYSAQVLFTTACCLLIWLLIREAKWKWVFSCAVCLVLLFHTHLLSFAVAIATLGIMTPVMAHRDRQWWKKWMVLAGVVAMGTMPWVIVTGFYHDQARIPRAWTLLTFPADLWRYPPVKLWALLTGSVFAAVSIWIVLCKPQISERFTMPFKKLLPFQLLVTIWAGFGYLAFLFCIPAVSFTSSRLNLSYWGPLFLLFSVMSAVVARAVAGRASPIVAAVIMLTVSLGTGHTIGLHLEKSRAWNRYQAIFKALNSEKLDSAARIYSMPSEHLVLTFYSGLPIQDMLPVRKSFLDSYPGDIVFIDGEWTVETDVLAPRHIQAIGRENHSNISPRAAREWSVLLRTRQSRERMTKIVRATGSASLESLPSFAKELLAEHNSKVQSYFAQFNYELVARGFPIRCWADWVAICKFRFVNPAQHVGTRANYADRLRGAKATLLPLPEPVALYYSRLHASAAPQERISRRKCSISRHPSDCHRASRSISRLFPRIEPCFLVDTNRAALLWFRVPANPPKPASPLNLAARV